MRRFSSFLRLLPIISVLSTPGYSKVYRNVPIGEYSNEASFSLTDCNGKSFLSFMKKSIYPALERESANRTTGQHIDAIRKGEGVELRLTEDVSTYHVKYKAHNEEKAERSGRSFSAVGSNPKRPSYVADASYSHYLDTFEAMYEDEEELKSFYEAILNVVAECDGSGFDELSQNTKQVAADFVAVYVAEQYRHLISGKGKRLGPRHNWDDALLQVTLLASFHSGQTKNKNGMFYEGTFTDQVFNQKYDVKENGESVSYCVYKQPKHPKRDELKKREIRLKDYWQFNKTCDRSGVNVTRRDFTKMGQAITEWKAKGRNRTLLALKKNLESSSNNLYSAISSFFINDSTPTSLEDSADDLIESIVKFLMEVRTDAVAITEDLG